VTALSVGRAAWRMRWLSDPLWRRRSIRVLGRVPKVRICRPRPTPSRPPCSPRPLSTGVASQDDDAEPLHPLNNTGRNTADLIIAQAGLERLAHATLVLSRKLSPSTFEQLTAADKIQGASTTLGVPIGVPSELPELAKWAQAQNIPTAAQAVTRLRNRMAHPPRKKLMPAQRERDALRADARQLSLVLLELGLLATIGMMQRFSPEWRDESAAKASYLAYNEQVRSTAPRDRLVDWHRGDGWEPICSTLGIAVPGPTLPPCEHDRRNQG
jgi:Sulfotransferase domain